MLNIATCEKEGIYWKFYDIVSIEEVLIFTKEMLGDSKFDDLKYFIWDASDIKNLNILNDGADSIAAMSVSTLFYKSEIKVALVIEDENMNTFFERFITTSLKLGTTWEFKLFRCIEGARNWVVS